MLCVAAATLARLVVVARREMIFVTVHGPKTPQNQRNKGEAESHSVWKSTGNSVDKVRNGVSCLFSPPFFLERLLICWESFSAGILFVYAIFSIPDKNGHTQMIRSVRTVCNLVRRA